MSTELATLLRRIVAQLESENTRFMIAGSFASSAHGVSRATQDLDIIIDPPDLAAFERVVDGLTSDSCYLDPDAARDAFRRRSMFNLIDHASGWKIDFILRKNRAFSREEMGRRVAVELLGVPVHVASPEDTIVAKLEWSAQSGGSEKQRRDIAGIIAALGTTLDVPYVERWVDELGLRDEWRAAQSTPL